MACLKREKTGTCNHDQCPFPKETEHHHECLEFIWVSDRALCEIGYNCLAKCPHAFFSKDIEKEMADSIEV